MNTDNKKRILGLVAITLLTLALFFPTVFMGRVPLPTDLVHDYLLDQPREGQNPLVRDSVVQMYPSSVVVFDSWKQWTIPKINPYIFTNGVELLATGQTTALSPFNLLIPLYNDSVRFFSHQIVLTFWLAGIFMYLFLLYRPNAQPVTAVLGAIAYQLSGPLIAWLSWGTIGVVLAFLPLGFFAIDRLAKKQNYGWAFLIFIVHYFMLTAGHLQFYLYATVVMVLYGMYRLAQERSENSKREYFIWGATLVSIILTSVAYLVPFLEALPGAHRATISTFSVLEPAHLLQLALPQIWGDQLLYTAPLNYTETFGYVGIIFLILALLSPIFFRRKDQKEYFFWVAVMGGALLYTTIPVIQNLLGSIVPQLVSFPPMRALFVIGLGVIIIGHDALVSLLQRIPKPWIRVAPWIVMLLIAITAIDQGHLFVSYIPQQDPSPLREPPTYITAIQDGPVEVPLVYSEVSPLNLYGLYGIRSIFGYDSMYSEEYYQLIRSHAYRMKSHRNILNARIFDESFLRELGVSYVILPSTRKREITLPLFYEDDFVRVYRLPEDGK